jgi:hypothetical protein
VTEAVMAVRHSRIATLNCVKDTFNGQVGIPIWTNVLHVLDKCWSKSVQCCHCGCCHAVCP